MIYKYLRFTAKVVRPEILFDGKKAKVPLRVLVLYFKENSIQKNKINIFFPYLFRNELRIEELNVVKTLDRTIEILVLYVLANHFLVFRKEVAFVFGFEEILDDFFFLGIFYRFN